jgi:hypothetical protein
MVKKKSIQDLEKKLQRLEQEKIKVQEQQDQLKKKEKDIEQAVTQAKAEYVTALLSQSNTSLADLKGLLLEDSEQTEEGGES